MATAAQRKAAEEKAATAASTEESTEGTTTLDSDVTKPSVTAPGDGPADTTDPTEQAVSDGLVTTLDSDVTKPSVTAPGDGPADTTDPTEQAVSVPPQPDEEALKVGTVNAVQPAPEQPKPTTRSKAKVRTEEYEATKPDGEVVTIVRNIDTGESKIKE